LRAAAGMVEVRDMRRALEFAAVAHERAPSAPEPALFVAEVAYAVGDGSRVTEFAREALARKGGPLFLLDDREAVIAAALQLAQAGEALRVGAAHAAAAGTLLAAPCPCGSGKMHARCCGAVS